MLQRGLWERACGQLDLVGKGWPLVLGRVIPEDANRKHCGGLRNGGDARVVGDVLREE